LDDFIYKYIDYDLTTVKITDLNRDIFGWLELQDINVIIIIALIILVSGINMTSALMIMILERTGFIGLLKAMGATNWKIRKIFLINAAYLIALGLFWGNIVGVGLCFLQDKFKLVSLPQEQYYIEHVPINLDLSHVLFLNVGTLVLCTLMLVIPSYFVSKIAPIKALRFN
jgi:lipoprotein-releasing system permease protein